MIGTHNSATGEKSKWTSLWVVPFARCQSKTLIEQFDAGCRSFDLRIKYGKNGEFVFAHGLWQSSVNVFNTLKRLQDHIGEELIFVNVMYEGSYDNMEKFAYEIEWLIGCFPSMHLTYITVKRGKSWIRHYEKHPQDVAYFKILDGRSWHTIIPLPYLWAKIYKPKFEDDNCVNIVDFL